MAGYIASPTEKSNDVSSHIGLYNPTLNLHAFIYMNKTLISVTPNNFHFVASFFLGSIVRVVKYNLTTAP